MFDERAPENLRFGRQQLTNARFSLSRTEPMPFAPLSAEKAFAETSLSLSARIDLEWE